jgi:hypothetical protein
MLTTLFLTINNWITGTIILAAIGCFLWGIVSIPVESLPHGLHPTGNGLCGRSGSGS